MSKVKIGDEKTIYSYFDEKLQEANTTCVGFMTDKAKTPVWHSRVIKRESGFQILDLYCAFDRRIGGISQGYFETPEEVFAHMHGLADLGRVQNEFLIANIAKAEEAWIKKTDD